MGTNIRHQILQNIDNIYSKSKNSRLSEKLFEKINSDLEILSDYLKLSKRESFLFAMVFTLNYNGDTVDYPDLIKYFNCSPIKLIDYGNDFDNLVKNSYFSTSFSIHRGELGRANTQYTINEKITDAIMENKPLPNLDNSNFKSIIDVLERLYDLGKQRGEDKISTFLLRTRTNGIIEKNIHFPLIKRVKSMNFSDLDAHIFLYLVWKLINGTNSVYLDKTAETIYDKSSNKVYLIQDVIKGNNALIKQKLIEIEQTKFINDTKIKLSKKSIKIIKDCDIDVYTNQQEEDNVIVPKNIAKKKLFYNSKESSQITIISDLLKNRKFKEVQKRLEDKRLPRGVAILLFGSSGTGKTETVYQIAKNTNRKIMQVDISQSKSMWFGESEKVIKKIFTDYYDFAEECKSVPILLFNEADAILSKRKDSSSSSVAQTENAIQNIILQELEKFNGIFLATTNLVKNLDSAFERRFLFKIQFQKPNTTIRAKIWKSKLPFLEIEDCNLLADKFDFSGGQIDNILRKNEIHEIIHGEKVNLKNLMVFCSEETLGNNSMKIGFKN